MTNLLTDEQVFGSNAAIQKPTGPLPENAPPETQSQAGPRLLTDEEVFKKRGSAASDAAPSAAPAGDAEAEHEQRIGKYMPQMRQAAAEGKLPGPSTLDYLPIISPVGQRAGAAFTALLGSGEGQDFGERYASQLAKAEAQKRASREAHPVYGTVANVAGEIGGMAVLPGLGLAGRFVAPASKLAGRIAEGGLYGAASGITETLPGESPEQAAKRIAADIAMGTTAAAVLPPIIRGASGMIGRGVDVVSNLFGRDTSAYKTIAKSSAKYSHAPGLTLDEYEAARARGEPVSVMDIKGAKEEVQKAGGTLGADHPEVQNLQAFLQDRLSERTNDMRRAMDDHFGHSIDAAELTRKADEAARAANKPAYDAAFSHPDARDMWTPELKNIINTGPGERALKFALEQSKLAEARAQMDPNAPRVSSLNNPFIRNAAGELDIATGQTTPNLQFWDWVKRGLNDEVNQLYRSGNKGEAANLSQTVTAFTGYLKDKVKPYESALSGAQKFFAGNNAFEAGQNFLNLADVSRATRAKRNVNTASAQIHKFEKDFSPEEQKLFNLGLASQIRENPEQASRAFAKGDAATLDSYRRVLGDDTFNAIDDNLKLFRIKAINDHLRPSEPGGWISRHPVFTAGGGGALALLGERVISDPSILLHPYPLIGLAGYAATGKVLSSARANEALNIIRMATSSDPEVHAKLVEAMARDARIKNFVTNLEQGMARVAATHAEGAEFPPRPSNPPAPKSFARGGAAKGIDHGAEADNLIALADKAKKAHNSTTEPLLDQPDEMITKALAIADKAI